MNNQNYIEATVDNMFTTRNERHMMIAFLFRELLDWTPREVGKYLSLSIPNVNALTTARHYKASLDTFEGETFKLNLKTCEQACSKFVKFKRTQEFIKSTELTARRLNQYYVDSVV
jgi:predicted component of type VI protein secretion system